MSEYINIANSNILFVLAFVVITFVMIQSIVFLKMAWKRGIEIGLAKEKMVKTVKSSAIFAIVPSVPIVISLMAIAPILGIPFSWLRLSIVGSASYELISAEMGAKSMGIEGLGASGYSPVVFSNSMWVMSIGIIWGLLACVLFLKKYQSSVRKINEKDSKWSEIMINSLFFGMLSVFLAEPIVAGGIELYVLLSSAVIMLLITKIAKQLNQGWLNDFAIAISMVSGMALAIIYTNIF